MSELSAAYDGSSGVLLTVDEAAQLLRIGRTLTYALIAAGQLESVRIGRLRRIRPEALTAFAAHLSTSPSK